MNESIKHCAVGVWRAVSRPELRHTMHYECGLYADHEASAPLASVRANNDFVMPIVKIAAVVGGTVWACALLKSAVRLVSVKEQRCCQQPRC